MSGRGLTHRFDARDAPGPGARASIGARVRSVRANDMPRLWQLVLALAEYERLSDAVTGTPERLAQLLFCETPAFDGLVIEEPDGTLAGYALLYTTASSFCTRRAMWLEDLFVDPGRRGSGYGRLLMAACARLALERGAYRLGWIVLDWNEPAIGFYRSLGAKPAPPEWLTYGLDEAGLKKVAAG